MCRCHVLTMDEYQRPSPLFQEISVSTNKLICHCMEKMEAPFWWNSTPLLAYSSNTLVPRVSESRSQRHSSNLRMNELKKRKKRLLSVKMWKWAPKWGCACESKKLTLISTFSARKVRKIISLSNLPFLSSSSLSLNLNDQYISMIGKFGKCSSIMNIQYDFRYPCTIWMEYNAVPPFFLKWSVENVLDIFTNIFVQIFLKILQLKLHKMGSKPVVRFLAIMSMLLLKVKHCELLFLQVNFFLNGIQISFSNYWSSTWNLSEGKTDDLLYWMIPHAIFSFILFLVVLVCISRQKLTHRIVAVVRDSYIVGFEYATGQILQNPGYRTVQLTTSIY